VVFQEDVGQVIAPKNVYLVETSINAFVAALVHYYDRDAIFDNICH
jgi:hypothetical protein